MKRKLLIVWIVWGWVVSLRAQVSVSIPNMNVQRGATADVPFQVSGILPSDSLIAYQLAVVYNPAVVQGVGASKSGTMTQNWDNPTFAIKAGKIISIGVPPIDTLRVVGITTNQPGKRVVQDEGILVKLNFLVTGNVGDTVSVRIQEIRLFHKSGEFSIGTKTKGLLTVVENASNTTVVLDLSPNWNLVSFPVIPEPNSLPQVFGEIPVTYVSTYISGVGPRTWDRGMYNFDPSLPDLRALDGLHGYWMKLSSQNSQSLSLTGDPVIPTTPIFLYKGWNLIPYLPSFPDSLWHAFLTLGKAYRFVTGYYPQEGGFKTWDRGMYNFDPSLPDLNILRPKYAYWVKMDTAKYLIYPSSGYKVPKLIVSGLKEFFEGVQSSPYWCDYWAFQPELLIPGDTVLVYDSDGVLCGDTLVSPKGAFLVHVIGDDPSTLEEDEGASEGDTLTFVIGGKGFPVYGTSQNFDTTIIPGPAIWTNMGSKRVQFKVEDHSAQQSKVFAMPRRIVLFQNYPNPFNQNTIIHYVVPYSEKIQLKIFDTQGREIRTWFLNNEEGYVVWDARDAWGNEVSSGIYLYQIETKQSIAVRKCLFLK